MLKGKTETLCEHNVTLYCLLETYSRPVHTEDDNYKDNDKDIVLKIVLNIKE